jgi:cardiolipin synthase A/B
MKMRLLALSLGLSLSLTAHSNTCLNTYIPKIDYSQTLTSMLLSLPPEMQMEMMKQIQISKQNDLSQVGTTRLEAMFFEHIAKAHAENRFDQAVDGMIQQLSALPQFQSRLGNVPEAKKAELIAMFKGGLLGELQLRSYFGKTLDTDIWSKIAKQIALKMDDFTQWIQLNVVQKLKKIASLTGTQLAGTKEMQFLIDGPVAFAKRDELVKNAKKSIHVLTWSIYDDVTGTKFATDMIEKKNQGVDVKIIVDALTAQKSGHNQQIGRMIQNGIEVIFSRNPKLFLSGQHRKAMVVDGEHVIAGGMNYGDVYSHMGNKDKWRDTDVYFTGSLVSKTHNLFVNEWNEQIKFHSLPFQPMAKVAVKTRKDESPALLLNSSPADFKTSGSPIMRSLLALIKGSKNEIIIENAYMISSPILENALKQAIERGVSVTIITNSSKSVDEPVVSNPILASALRLKKLGAHIVLKDGSTLHSKVALFDGEISMVTSYNLHPRSELIEDEMAYISADPKAAQQLRVALIHDIQTNTLVKDDSEIVLSEDPLTLFFNRLLYNQL